jgi:hypothetical protein
MCPRRVFGRSHALFRVGVPLQLERLPAAIWYPAVRPERF